VRLGATQANLDAKGCSDFLLVIPAKAGGALQQQSWSSSAFGAEKTLDPSFRWDDGKAERVIRINGEVFPNFVGIA
jgi:hypothetical protein